MRARLLPALVLSAALTLSACSGVGSDPGAVIDGHTYSVADIQAAVTDFNSVAQQPVTPQQVISVLSALPVLREELAGSTVQPSESELRQILGEAGVQAPDETTLDFIEVQHYLGALQGPAAAEDPALADLGTRFEEIQQRIAETPVEVNPRFGTWDPSQGGLIPEAPAWITSATDQS